MSDRLDRIKQIHLQQQQEVAELFRAALEQGDMAALAEVCALGARLDQLGDEIDQIGGAR
jgi:hypothetical protein